MPKVEVGRKQHFGLDTIDCMALLDLSRMQPSVQASRPISPWAKAQGCRLGLLMSVTSSKIVFTLRLRNELYRYSRTGTNFTHIGLEIVGAFQRHTTAVFCITGDVKLKFATKHHRSFQHAFPPCLSPLLLFHQWRNQKFLVEGVEVRHRQPYRDVEG